MSIVEKNTLIKDNLKKIENSMWYRQRFDACPHFMFPLCDAHTTTINQTQFPFGQKIAYAGFSKNRGDWYHSIQELENTANSIIKLSKLNVHISKEMISCFKKFDENFYQICALIKNMELSQISNAELLAIYLNFIEFYTEKLNSSPLIDGFSLTTDKIIAAKLNSGLKGQNLDGEFHKIFSKLTAPIFYSFLTQEKIDLLKIALNPIEKQNELLNLHQQNYFWIQNNYVNESILPIKYFQEKLNALNKLTENEIKKELEQLSSTPINNQKQKEQLIQKLKLSPELVNLIEITDDFSYWQDERKKATFLAIHYISQILCEISKRTNYTIQELKYTLPPEMPLIFENNLSKEELAKRFEYCMVIVTNGCYEIITDLKLIQKLDEIGLNQQHQTTQVNGFAASLGMARGKVKVLMSASENDKVKEGDILVAVMTRPDYLPAMAKAAAFVTDEGGITCHAAIVAREMHKPCIIGTKIATTALKDGDYVEVNANKGTILKINT